MSVAATFCHFQYGTYIYLTPAFISLSNSTYSESVSDDYEVNSVCL